MNANFAGRLCQTPTLFLPATYPVGRTELQRAGGCTGIGEATADEIHKTFRFFSVFRGQNWCSPLRTAYNGIRVIRVIRGL